MQLLFIEQNLEKVIQLPRNKPKQSNHKIFNHKQQLAKKDKYINSYHSITSSRRTSIQ